MRMLTPMLVAVLISWSGASVPVATAATPIVQHVGHSDPTAEGWTVDPNSPDPHVGGTEITASGSHDFWELSHSPSDQPLGTVTYALSSGQLSSDWRFVARVRVVDSPAWDGSGVPFTEIGVHDGTQWSFSLGNDFVGVLGPTTFPKLAVSAARDTRLDYHLYEIQFHGNKPGFSNDTGDFYYDGTLLFTGLGRSQLYSLSGREVLWGTTGSTTSVANYEHIAFVPEPGSLLALSVAFVCVLGRCSARSSYSPF